MDDPKARLPQPVVPQQFVTLTTDQFTALLARTSTTSPIDDEMLAKQARMQVEAHQRLTKRENEQHPGKSVFSNPRGEVEDPKPRLKCELLWAGMGEPADILTPEEITLINRVEPGEYTFTRTDGTPEQLLVVGERKANGSLRSMDFQFNCRGEYKANLPGKVAMLKEILGAKSEVEELKAENARLKQMAGVA